MAPPPGRIVFNVTEGVFNAKVTNSSKAYTNKELLGFGEMIQVLQSEGKVPVNGTILISQLEKM